MARSLRRFERFDQRRLARAQYNPAILADPVRTFGFKGEHRTGALTRIPADYSRLVQDLTLRYGVYATRNATVALGTASADLIVAAMEAVIANGNSFPLRFTADGVDVYNGGAWAATGGVAWATSNLRAFSATGWGDTVVFAEDTNGIYSLAFTVGFPKTLLTALAGVKHLTTFAGRIIASLDDRIQWCVRNDNTNWVGIGSGYEDLRSAPGGRPDAQTAVIPVSDDTAIVIRTGSVWQMNQTGDFDAPFQFTGISQAQGGRWPRCCCAIPRGAAWLGDDGAVYLLRLGEPIKDVSVPIFRSLQSTVALLRLSTMMYDPRYNELRLAIPTTSQIQGRVFRYNIDQDAWTEDVYPFPIRSIAFSLFTQALTIDDLIGLIDDLPGAIDDLTTGIVRAQVMFAMSDPRRYVVHESYNQNNDPLRDVRYDGARVAGGFRIETAIVRKGSPLLKNEVVQLQLEYEAEAATTFRFMYSDDGGATWNVILDVPAPQTSVPALLAVEGTYDREVLQFAVSCDATPNVRLIDLFAFIREGGLKSDAS